MAMYKNDDGTNYTEINEMPESGYVINEEKSLSPLILMILQHFPANFT
mgnify:CR=1 FL=1